MAHMIYIEYYVYLYIIYTDTHDLDRVLCISIHITYAMHKMYRYT
jgi:hypothetical protein